MSLNFLDAQWSGSVPADSLAPWRRDSSLANNAIPVTMVATPDALTGVSAAPQYQATDLSGGFFTDGEIGPVKVTKNVALTVAMLAWSLLDYQEWWAEDTVRLGHALRMVAHGTEYVNNCYLVTPFQVNGTTGPATGDALVYQVRFVLRFVFGFVWGVLAF